MTLGKRWRLPRYRKQPMNRMRQEEANERTMGLELLQANMGRGKAAGDLLNLKIEEGKWDIIAIQEPYRYYNPPRGYRRYKNEGGRNKVEIIIREGVGAIMKTQATNENWVTVTVDVGDGEMDIVNIYDEPEGDRGRGGSKFKDWTQTRYRRGGKQLIIGDMNAHNVAWGGNTNDERGEYIMEWAIAEDYLIENRRTSQPTFESTAGRTSWIDLTITKGIEIEDWRVSEEETLSDHKYIKMKIKLGKKETVVRKRNIDWNRVRKVALREELKKPIEGWGETECIEERAKLLDMFCRRALQRAEEKKRRTRRKTNEWWTRELMEARKELRKKRKNFQREINQEERERKKEEYRRERGEYKRAIEEEKRQSFVRFIERESEGNPWGVAYKIVAGKGNQGLGMRTVEREDGTWTENERQTTEYMLDKYFPRDTDEEEHIEETGGEQTMDEPFSEREIEECLKGTKRRKATVTGDIPNEMLTILYEERKMEIMELMNGCLERGIFPSRWKEAEIVWLPKKDGGKRPISLLPTIGKVLDKLVGNRIMSNLERRGKINERQYGFRTGRSTIDACENLIGRIREARAEGRHTLVITLDMSNAFNSVLHKEVGKQMRELGVPRNLELLARDFLRGRSIVSGGVRREINRGCPQGSSLGPTLWLIAMEGWFREMKEGDSMEPDDMIQAFADDQVIMVAARQLIQIETRWRVMWERCGRWSKDAGLEYNRRKTKMMFIPGRRGQRRDARPPRIKIDNEAAILEDNIKYLGITIDSKLIFLDHLKEVRSKAQLLANKIYVVAGKTWGTSSRTRKEIYERAIVPMIMYGAEIWGVKALDARLKVQLNAIQRPFLLSITKAYRTAPTTALQVIAGTCPLHIRARICWELYNEMGEDMKKQTTRGSEKPHPAGRWRRALGGKHEISGSQVVVYTDASEGEKGMGVAIAWREGNEWKSEGRVITGDLNIHEAEMEAVRMAAKMLRDRDRDGIVVTDSSEVMKRLDRERERNREIVKLKKLLEEKDGRIRVDRMNESREDIEGNKRADREARRMRESGDVVESINVRKRMKDKKREKMTQRWQKEWEEAENGRSTYEVTRRVGYDIIGLTHKGVQLVTGHGNMRAYLKRFNLSNTDGECDCGEGQEDANHVWKRCEIWVHEREIFEERLRQTGRELQLRGENGEDAEMVEIVNEFAGATLRDSFVE